MKFVRIFNNYRVSETLIDGLKREQAISKANQETCTKIPDSNIGHYHYFYWIKRTRSSQPDAIFYSFCPRPFSEDSPLQTEFALEILGLFIL
jgi:hypothetical protein